MHMYVYGIYPLPDEEIFNKQCLALEKNIPGIVKGELLVDVDGSKIQRYNLNGSKILVLQDFYTNDVHVKSEIELTKFFK